MFFPFLTYKKVIVHPTIFFYSLKLNEYFTPNLLLASLLTLYTRKRQERANAFSQTLGGKGKKYPSLISFNIRGI